MSRRTCFFYLIILSLIIGCQATKKERDPCTNPEYIRVKKDTMIDNIGRNDLYGALDAGLEAYRCDAKDSETNYWLGWTYMQRDQNDKALIYLQQALEYREVFPDANMALGMIYLDRNMLDESLEQFRTAAHNDLFRSAYEAYNNMGWIYILKGDYAQAEKELNMALKLNSNWCISHCNMGEANLAQGKTKQGIENLKKAIELCPQYARPHLLLGIEYNRQKRAPEACWEFNQAYNSDYKSEEGKKAEEYIKLLNCKRIPKKISP